MTASAVRKAMLRGHIDPKALVKPPEQNPFVRVSTSEADEPFSAHLELCVERVLLIRVEQAIHKQGDGTRSA